MPFPFSSQGTLFVDTGDLERVIAAVESVIQRAKPSSIATTDRHIEFTAGLFRSVSSWNLLVSIESGRVTFEKTDRGIQVRYVISFVQMFFVVTIMVVVLFEALPVISWGNRAGVPLPVVGLMWLWLFGMNYVIATFRFPAALRGALRDVSRLPPDSPAAREA
jgi:hypothetical protein